MDSPEESRLAHLERLAVLHERGALTADEFAAAKRRLFADGPPATPASGSPAPAGLGEPDPPRPRANVYVPAPPPAAPSYAASYDDDPPRRSDLRTPLAVLTGCLLTAVLMYFLLVPRNTGVPGDDRPLPADTSSAGLDEPIDEEPDAPTARVQPPVTTPAPAPAATTPAPATPAPAREPARAEPEPAPVEQTPPAPVDPIFPEETGPPPPPPDTTRAPYR